MNVNPRGGPRRRAMLNGALGLASAGMWSGALAQPAWPARPVRVVIGFAVGGGMDVMARTLGLSLMEETGKSFVVDNKLGASGSVAAGDVIRSPADGYSVLITTTLTQTVNPALMKGSPNMSKDLVPVCIVGRFKFYLVVRGDLPVKSVGDLVALAKAQPGKLNYASPGPGSQPHLLGEMFQRQAGISMVHVPYKGSNPALQALLTGEADLAFDPGLSNQHVEAGKLRMLATTSDKRPARFPQVPMFKEVGVQNMEAEGWIGVWVPAGTPADVSDKLNRLMANAVANPTTKRRFDDMSAEAIHIGPPQFRELLRKEDEVMSALVRERKITVE